MKPKVSVIATQSYDLDLLCDVVEQHFSSLNFKEEVTPTSKIVIKPNLLMKRTPEEGTTTHPTLVHAVVLWLEKHGATDITIADSPGGPYTKSALQGIYSTTGMALIAEKTSAKLNMDFEWQTVHHPKGVLCKEFQIINPLIDVDIIINLPKLKTHGMMQLSGGVKNLFGAVPGLMKPELHFRFPEPEEFSQMLVDVSTLVAPTITIVDAVVAMEGDGPSSGNLRNVGMTFSARDIYALDVALCDYIGMAHKEAYMIQTAIKNGISPTSVDEIDYVGEGYPVPDLEYKKPTSSPIDFMKHAPKWLEKPLVWFGKHFFSPRPVVHKRECIGCGKCEESCAPKAVEVHSRKAVIEYKKCIKCYCCHEMCPVKAISIRRGFLLTRF